MKVNIEKEGNRVFQPVTIKLTIENIDELYYLWHRFNVEDQLGKDLTESPTIEMDYSSMLKLYDFKKTRCIRIQVWRKLNDIIEGELK